MGPAGKVLLVEVVIPQRTAGSDTTGMFAYRVEIRR